MPKPVLLSAAALLLLTATTTAAWFGHRAWQEHRRDMQQEVFWDCMGRAREAREGRIGWDDPVAARAVRQSTLDCWNEGLVAIGKPPTNLPVEAFE